MSETYKYRRKPVLPMDKEEKEDFINQKETRNRRKNTEDKISSKRRNKRSITTHNSNISFVRTQNPYGGDCNDKKINNQKK